MRLQIVKHRIVSTVYTSREKLLWQILNLGEVVNTFALRKSRS